MTDQEKIEKIARARRHFLSSIREGFAWPDYRESAEFLAILYINQSDKIQPLIEALKFYAYAPPAWDSLEMQQDKGDKARQALDDFEEV